MISFNCPNCGKNVSTKDTAAGRRGKCPGCGVAVQVPALASDDDVLAALGEYDPPKPIEAVTADVGSEPPPRPEHPAPATEPTLAEIAAKPLTTSGRATASLIAGISGLLCFPAGVIAVVLGVLAIKEISDPTKAMKGKDIAVVGISCGCLGLLLALVALIMPNEIDDADSRLAKGNQRAKAESQPPKAESPPKVKTREEVLQPGFSMWDGSHKKLTTAIKDSMNDPSSYEHVETVYHDLGDYLIVKTTFRGKNAFGGVVKNWVKARVSVDGSVIQIIEQGP
ncbi:MAG: DUF4190 domain-containing protein [Candidatus Paceibacterota bacterium]